MLNKQGVHMNKGELIEAIANKSGLPKTTVATILDSTLGVVKETLADGGEIQITGFGRFFVNNRAERTGRNPQTGAPQMIPAAKVPAFKPGKTLKESTNIN